MRMIIEQNEDSQFQIELNLSEAEQTLLKLKENWITRIVRFGHFQ